MKLKTLAAAAGLAFIASTAWAVPIVGTASLAGGFEAVSAANNAIVSDLNFINVNNAANATLLLGTTGNFSPAGFATSSDFTIAPFVPGMIYSFNGFTLTIQSIASLVRTPLFCAVNGSGCNDSLGFDIFGTVTKVGFDATQFSGTWTGNGTCNQGTQTACQNNTKSGSWSASIVAAGQPVQIPEPGSLALVGLALAGVGVATRRKTRG